VASDNAIRGSGVPVWPNEASPDERDDLIELVDFDIAC
jgi:hypothetical protein